MKKFRDVKTLTACAMLVAVAIILGFFKIPVTSVVEIRFGTIPIAVAGAMFGPFPAAVVGALADIGAYMVRPTGPFFPGFTVSSAVTGFIFGSILYKKQVTVFRIALAEAVHTAAVGLILNTVWLSVLYGMPLYAVFASRFLKEFVMLFVNTAILTAVLRPVLQISGIRRVLQ